MPKADDLHLKGTAFVIMPILSRGSKEYEYFRALFDEIKSVLEDASYDTKRADDFERSGAITKDVIRQLAEADIVVADLTNLNPNVFYELGVRHTLRGVGTILILDQVKTKKIPFDLGAHRVITFKSTLPGFRALRKELSTFVKNVEKGRANSHYDNPVHDWLKELPSDVLKAALGVGEERLRAELSRANTIIQAYDRIHGPLPGVSMADSMAPPDVIEAALDDVRHGNLAIDLMERAESAAAGRDRKSFLETVERCLQRADPGLLPTDYDALQIKAYNLGLGRSVRGAILAKGLFLFPTSDELQRSQLRLLSYSPDPNDRKKARETLAQIIGVKITPTEVRAPSTLDARQLDLLHVLLETYDQREDAIERLRIVEAFSIDFRRNSIVCRNMGKALRMVGRLDEAWTWFREAILVPDALPLSAQWYGINLVNVKRYVDGIEAFLAGCRMNPHDALCFSSTADGLAHVWVELVSGKLNGRMLPDDIDLRQSTRNFIAAAFGCPEINQGDASLCRKAATRAEIDLNEVVQLSQSTRIPTSETDQSILRPANPPREYFHLEDRITLVNSLYEKLRSEVTYAGH
jgi:tetratricopeptide (TPR) repeat protein